MKVAVIGAGAMGSIYGAHLSLHNEVYMIDTLKDVVDYINEKGITLEEDNKSNVYYPKAITNSKDLPEMDIVILFVKAIYSRMALESNKNIIGKNTYILTLQNGAGHEDILADFTDKEHIIIGTTEDNGAVLRKGLVKRGGVGNTNIGMITKDNLNFLPKLKATFDECGFNVNIYENMQQLIWNKLFTNVSLSVVTAILQVKIGYIRKNEYAWNMTKALIHEAVQVALAMGLEADEEEIVKKVESVSINSPDGITSICADLANGRRTEVDTISGSVINAADKVNVEVPIHRFVVNTIHALEFR